MKFLFLMGAYGHIRLTAFEEYLKSSLVIYGPLHHHCYRHFVCFNKGACIPLLKLRTAGLVADLLRYILELCSSEIYISLVVDYEAAHHYCIWTFQTPTPLCLEKLKTFLFKGQLIIFSISFHSSGNLVPHSLMCPDVCKHPFWKYSFGYACVFFLFLQKIIQKYCYFLYTKKCKLFIAMRKKCKLIS